MVKQRRNRRDYSKCAYCGHPATSKDHVPPKCIFPRERDDLITVPACNAHNGERSRLDALLLEFLGLFAAQVEPFNHELWERAWKSIKRSRRDRILRERLVHDQRSSLAVVGVEAAPFIASIKFIARGLYWHHTGACLGLDTRISGSMWRPDVELPMLSRFTSRSIAKGQFVYAFGVAEDGPKTSAWYMQFHGNVLAAIWTGALADNRDHET